VGRILALDLGSKRIGVAISDPLKLIAQPLQTLSFKNNDLLLEEIIRLVKAYDVERVIIGLPLHADGRESPGCQRARAWQSRLNACGLVCELFDERNSSQEARRVFQKSGKRVAFHREVIDRLAAAIILKEYLAQQART